MREGEQFAIIDGMEQVNREMVAKIEAAAPMCHFRKMRLEFSDWLEADYWECSVCGHTKPV